MFYFFNANYCIHYKLKKGIYGRLKTWKKIQHPNKYGQEGNQLYNRTV